MLLSAFGGWRSPVGRFTIEAGLLDEHGDDDEEDQQVQHEVEHRREVDAVLFSSPRGGMSARAHVRTQLFRERVRFCVVAVG